MKSSIKIDFVKNDKGLEPCIAVRLVTSDDVRDVLLKEFFTSLGNKSSWVQVHFEHHIKEPFDELGNEQDKSITLIKLTPVSSEELPGVSVEIKAIVDGAVVSQFPLNKTPFINQ